MWATWEHNMLESRASKHLAAATHSLISLMLLDKTTYMSLACLLEPHSPLYGHQLPSFIALTEEHTAIRAIPQLLQSGVAVHCPQSALPLRQRGALTVQQLVIVNTVTSIHRNNSPLHCSIVLATHQYKTINMSVNPLPFSLQTGDEEWMFIWQGRMEKWHCLDPACCTVSPILS